MDEKTASRFSGGMIISCIQHPPTDYLILSSTKANKKGWVSKGLDTNEEKNHECHARNIKPMDIILTHGYNTRQNYLHVERH
jgi:hypothetical protein